MITMHGKTYYPVGAYPVLFAAGGVFLELAWPKWVVAATVAIFGLIGLPLALPILPVQTYLAYQDYLGVHPPQLENEPSSRLPHSTRICSGGRRWSH